MDEGRAADSEAIREEDRRIRRLQVVVFLALRTISQDQITYAQARAALTTASGMFRELGMETYGARSEAELRVVADGTPGC